MKNYDELREKVKALKQSIETGMLIPITEKLQELCFGLRYGIIKI